MVADAPSPPPAHAQAEGPTYPLLGLTFSGNAETIERLRGFAEQQGVQFGSVERHGGAETVVMPSNVNVVDPAFIAIINEAQSGRLGKIQTAFVTGQRAGR